MMSESETSLSRRDMSALSQGGTANNAARRVSRRTVLLGLGGLIVVGGGLGGWAAWNYARSHLSQYTYHGHTTQVLGVAWSPDGRRIASGANDGLRIWDAFNGGHVLVGEGVAIDHLRWSPRGDLIASCAGDAGLTTVWNATTAKQVFSYADAHSSAGARFHQYGLAWSPDGRRLASGGDTIGENNADDFAYSLQSWDARTGGNVQTYGHRDSTHPYAITFLDVAWSPDGQLIAALGRSFFSDQPGGLLVEKQLLQIWDARVVRKLFEVSVPAHSTEAFCSASWSPDSRRLVVADLESATVQIWDIVEGRRVLAYTGHQNSVVSVAWSPDGRHIASGGFDDTVRVWDAASGETFFTYDGHNQLVRAVAWSPDSVHIASASNDGTVQIWSPG